MQYSQNLEEEGIKTVTGNRNWNSSVIHKMLMCEKYMGDAILQKTYTLDFITKKRVKNDGYVKRYYIENNHEAIINRQQYYEVQEELKRRCNKNMPRIRHSSKYPLSGLIQCASCDSTYNRVTWYEGNGKENTIVWRYSERIKFNKGKCKKSPAIRETIFHQILQEKLQMIIDSDIKTSSSLVLRTKSSLVNCMNNGDVQELFMTGIALRRIIEKIIIQQENKVTIRFRSGLVLETTLC